MMLFRRYSSRAVRPPLALAIASTCGGCGGVLDPAGPIGAADRLIMLNSLAIMLAIVVPTILTTLGVAWWFRASNTRAAYDPTFVHSGRLELLVWSIPLGTVLLLSGVTWIGAHQLDPAEPLPGARKPLEVQVVSLDWKWLFIYPDQGIASVNELVIPASAPVHFSLTSASVMNVFFVPQLGSMIYTMNGMTTRLHLQADRPGDFLGLAAHFSGDGFPDMHFPVHAVSADAFGAWVNKARAGGPTLDDKAYLELAKQSMAVAPAVYREVAPNLFQSIVTQRLPPGPGPSGGASTTVSPR
jgi:cytochrome o ubiquinol oxidase subunit II